MSGASNPEVSSLWQNVHQIAVDAELPDISAFGKECNQLLRECYAPLFNAIAEQQALETNPLLDVIQHTTLQAKRQLLEPKDASPGDLYRRVEGYEFYEFLADKGIVAGSDFIDDDAQSPIKFSEYIKNRDALQNEFYQECAEYGTKKSEAKKMITDFDQYFKMQMIDEHFAVTGADALYAWMNNNEHDRIKPPTSTINAESAVKAPDKVIKSRRLGDAPGFLLN